MSGAAVGVVAAAADQAVAAADVVAIGPETTTLDDTGAMAATLLATVVPFGDAVHTLATETEAATVEFARLRLVIETLIRTAGGPIAILTAVVEPAGVEGAHPGGGAARVRIAGEAAGAGDRRCADASSRRTAGCLAGTGGDADIVEVPANASSLADLKGGVLRRTAASDAA